MGSDMLILDERVAVNGSRLGYGASMASTKRAISNARTFTRLSGLIYPTAAPDLAQRDPDIPEEIPRHLGHLESKADSRRDVLRTSLIPQGAIPELARPGERRRSYDEKGDRETDRIREAMKVAGLGFVHRVGTRRRSFSTAVDGGAMCS
jgi:hypothetical protein